MQEYSEKFGEFIRQISKKDNVALFHDVDGDGIPAAAMTTIALKRLGLKVDLTIGKGREEITLSEETIKALQLNKIDYLITLDKPVDKNARSLREVSRFAKILMIDHHSNEGKIDVDESRVVIFKPQFFSNITPAKYCTSKIVFDYFSKLTNIEDLDWMACAGTMSDATEDKWMEFVQGVQKKYGFKGKDVWKTDLEKIVGYISHSECYKKGYYTKALSALEKARGPIDFLNSDLKKYYEAVSSEVETYIKNVNKNGEFTDDLLYYEINPKYNIKTILATILSRVYYPAKTIVMVVNDGNEKLSVSFRRSDYQKDMVKLSKESLKGLTDASPGGHIPAAGGSVWKEKLPDFKKKVAEINKSGAVDLPYK